MYREKFCVIKHRAVILQQQVHIFLRQYMSHSVKIYLVLDARGSLKNNHYFLKNDSVFGGNLCILEKNSRSWNDSRKFIKNIQTFLTISNSFFETLTTAWKTVLYKSRMASGLLTKDCRSASHFLSKMLKLKPQPLKFASPHE